MRRSRLMLHVLAAIAASGCVTAQAQSLSLDGVAVSGQHELLGRPLVGVGMTVRLRPDRWLSFRLRAELTWSVANRTGYPCTVSIVEPPACALQPLQDHGKLLIASVGVAGRVVGNQRWSMALTGDFSAGRVSVDSRGSSSGSEVNASGSLIGVSVGALGIWRIPRTRLALQVAGEVGVLGQPPGGDDYVDRGPPFSGDFDVRRLVVGLSISR